MRNLFINRAFFLCVLVWYVIILPVNILYADSDTAIVILSYQDSVNLGQDIFYAKYTSLDSTQSCIQCHYLIKPDTFNWNPSVVDIAKSTADWGQMEMEDLFIIPMTDKLFISHENFELSSGQIAMIKAYLDQLVDVELIRLKKANKKKLAYIIWITLLFMVILDKLFFRIVKVPYFHFGISLIVLVFLFKMSYEDVLDFGLQQGYEPDQPIKFSHLTHVEQNEIECLYCHMTAIKGKSAGIPGVSICMNCHAGVTEGINSGAFEINKILKANENCESIPWIRVNNLPDHVAFDHALHFEVGKIDCAECHGLVETSNRMVQETELSMSWCLDCHEERYVKPENAYYLAHFSKLKQEKDSVSVKEAGGWDCMKCHY